MQAEQAVAVPGRGGSLRRRAQRGFGLSVALLVIGAGLAGLGLVTVGHDRARLLDQIDPAIQDTVDYETALVDQSANARLYAETGAPTALSSYRAAVADGRVSRLAQRNAVGRLPGLVSDLATTDLRIAAWQHAYVDPLVVRPGPDAADRLLLSRSASTEAFKVIRARFAATEARLERIRTGAVHSFDDALGLLAALVVAVFIGVSVLLVLLWLWVRRSVILPLAALGADSRSVTAGDLDHAVSARGPTEITELALDIEAMRSRVVDDLHALETAHLAVAGQRRALEEGSIELARSNRDLEQFAYVASHDLQEPLRKVAAFCQLLADRYEDQLDDRGQQYIEFAVDGAKRMQALVSDLLSLSRVGRTRDNWGSVDLGVAARRAASNLESRLQEGVATLEIPDVLPTVHGDLTLLTALFQNLIGNALKFRTAAAPTIAVGSRQVGDVWEVRVSDNGIGIEPQYAERVFVIFQRLHTRDRYEGTGIGLALCRRIIEFHGGRIYAEERPPPGTTICFTLPVTETARVAETAALRQIEREDAHD